MRICPACGRENPSDAGFCNGCGAVLAAPPPPREQRKTVTVLFCDVTGSTAMGEQLDPESLRRVMRRYFDAARREIERHGGTVEKFIGDAVMAVFGLPQLHEDDALRAVRAAAGVRDALAVLNGELERDFGTTVTVRIGVNTGEVVTGTDERLATGDAINLASRLEQAATPGEIVIGAETWRLVRDVVSVEALAPLDLKGKSLPVTAYRLLTASDDASGPPRRIEATLIGREHQLSLLKGAIDSVVREQSCNLFTILGVAGVGKSRLSAEFLRTVDTTIVRGRCLSYGDGITYFPVVSMLKQLLDSDTQPGAIEVMGRDAKVATAIQVLLGKQNVASSPVESAWAVRKLFEAAARYKPLVAVFDDLHWGEPTLFDLIEHVADYSRDAPILILCNARPELLDRRPAWSGGKLNATTLLLEPLNAEDTGSLIDELLSAGHGIKPELRSRVQATAGGNPLFVEEMLAVLSESSGGELIVPPTIQALLAARLDQLHPEERSVLERGSIEGLSFHRGAVEVMAPEDRDVPGRLMTLVRKDLVRPDRATFSGEDAFRFRHLLIRDAAYERLSKAERAELHERFAVWLLQRGADLVELDEIAGYHLEQAYRYRAALGPLDEMAQGLAIKAAGHLKTAGLRAMDRGDATAAVNLLERARLPRPSQSPDLRLEEALIQSLAMCGRLDDAIGRADAIADECAARADRVGELRARLMGERWRLMTSSAPSENLRALVERARPVIEASDDDAALASLESAATQVEHMLCRFDAALAALTRWMQHARRAGTLWFGTEANEGGVAVAKGSMPAVEALRWLEVVQASGGGFDLMLDVWRSTVLALLGRFDEARLLFEETVTQMRERGLTTWAAVAMMAAWENEMLAGDPTAAERCARQSCEELEKLGERGWLSTAACQLADSLCSLGRYDESELWVRRGLELGASDDAATQLRALMVGSKLAAHRGDHHASISMAERADALASTTEACVEQGDVALTLAMALHLAGDDARAEAALQRAIEHYERKGAIAYIERTRHLTADWARTGTHRSTKTL